MLDHGPIHQGHEKRNPWRQHVHRATRPRSYASDKVWEAVTSRCLGNGRSDASYKQYGGVSASYKQFSVSASYQQYVSDECTYNIQSRQKHNMLYLLHAACLKLLVFFSLRFVLTLHSHLRVGLVSGVFPSVCSTNVCIFHLTVPYIPSVISLSYYSSVQTFSCLWN